MSWTEIDERWGYPEGATPDAMWKNVTVERIAIDPQIVRDFVDEVARGYEYGNVCFASFIVGSGGTFDWFASRNRFDELDFFRRFLTHPAVRAALPELTDATHFDEEAKFTWTSALTLDGVLGSLLVGGRVRGKPLRSHIECKRIGMQICEEMFGERFEDVVVFNCEHSWSNWFYYDVPNLTWLIVDKRLQRVSVLAFTDGC